MTTYSPYDFEEHVKRETKDIVSRGIAQCIYEPRGDYGLEGYQLNDHYYFEKCKREGKTYFRVFPEFSRSNYYETCGKNNFLKCFNIVNEFK